MTKTLPVSMHPNRISNSGTLSNNYVLLLSVHVYSEENGVKNEAIVFSDRFEAPREIVKKQKGWCTAQCKVLLFCVKPSGKSHAILN